MSQVTFQPGVGPTNTLDPTQGVQNTSTAATTGAQIPPAGSQSGAGPAAAPKDIPLLPSPKHGGLSLEQMVQALGMENRQLAVKMGLEAIEGKKAEIEELNSKKMDEIQKQLDTLKEKDKLSPFLKAFKWIGMVLGAIASVASLAVGIATGNPLLIAGGIIGCTMVVNSIVSEATEGKVSIGAGVTAALKGMGVKEETAKWIGFGVEMGLSLVGAALSIGGAVQVAKSAATAASTVAKVAIKTVTIANMAGGTVQVAQGGLGIASSHYDNQIAKARAELKDLEAVLLRITEAQAMDKDFLDSIMERTQALWGEVMDIVKGNVEAQTAVLTGAPSMA
jgi:hypothetical protein